MTDYLIVQRDGRWWVVIDGARRGPYITRQAAMEGALHLARTDFKAGIGATVSVEAGVGFDTLYNSRS